MKWILRLVGLGLTLSVLGSELSALRTVVAAVGQMVPAGSPASIGSLANLSSAVSQLAGAFGLSL